MRECFYCQSDQDSLCFHAPPLGGVVMCQTWNRLCPFLTGGSFFVWPWEPWSDMLEPASTPSDDACLYREQCAGALIAGSHQPSSCLYDCVGVWRPQMDDSHVRRSLLLSFWPLPSPTNFYCNQPLCVYMRAWMCVWPIWTSKMSVCIPTGVWLMCCESCKEGWLGVRRHKEDIRNHSRQEEREEGQERISTRSYSRSFGPGCLISRNNYCKNKMPLAKWLEESKTYL